jgi:hypothetical protein
MLYASNQMMSGIYRAAAKTAAGFSSVFLSSAERILSRQASMSREAVGECTEAAMQMDSAGDLPELLSIQARLLHSQIDRSMIFWADLYTEIGSGQKEVLRVSRASTFEALDRLGRTLEGVSAPPGTEPVVSAMRLVVNATRSSYMPSGVAPTGAAPQAAADKPEIEKEAGEQAAA